MAALIAASGTMGVATAASSTEAGVTFLPWPADMIPSADWLVPVTGHPQTKMSRDGTTVAASDTILGYASQVIRWNVAAGTTDRIGDFPGTAYLGGISTNGKALAIQQRSLEVGIPGDYLRFWSPSSGLQPVLAAGYPIPNIQAMSNDAKTILFGTNGIYYWKSGNSTTTVVPGVDSAYTSRALSGNGRYVFGSIGTAMFRYDLNTGTMLSIPTPASGTWVPTGTSDDGKTMTGYRLADGTYALSGFRWTPNDGVQMLGSLFVGAGIGQSWGMACSPDGSIIVGGANLISGYNPVTGGGIVRASIWTKELGLRRLEDVMATQGISMPSGWVFTRATDVTVADGLVYVCGVATSQFSYATSNVQVRFTMPAESGVPVDLTGAYLTARNATVGATTDWNLGYTSQVFSTGASSAPYSDYVKRPAALENVDLRGHSYRFDVDLGPASRWPDLSSTLVYGNGNAAEGRDGAAFVVRAAGSNGNFPIDPNSDNGLRIAFYRRDGRFWGHAKNLWYNQDIAIPYGEGASRYRVKVSVADDGPFDVDITQLNGTGAGTLLSTHFVGGSIESVGLTNASFLVQMINRTSDAVAAPTMVRLTNFGTDAVPNALFVRADQPFLKPYDFYQERLSVANLTRGITGFKSTIQDYGTPSSYIGGNYESSDVFTTGQLPLVVGGGNLFTLSAMSPEPVSKADRPLATLWFGNISPLALASVSHGNELYKSSGAPFVPNLLASNQLVFDGTVPFLSATLFQNGNSLPSGIALSGATELSLVVADSSGLMDNPKVSIDFGNHGTFDIRDLPLGVKDAATGRYSCGFTIPRTVRTMRMVIRAIDNAGNENLQESIVTIDPGVTLKVRLQGLSLTTPIRRTVRIVLGSDSATFAVINKVLTFTSPVPGQAAEATICVGPGNDYNVATPHDLTWAFVKDPYHSMGKRVTLTETADLAYAQTTIPLVSGDLNNDNVVDIGDLLTLASRYGAWVGTDTALLTNSAGMIPMDQRHPDLTGDAGVLGEDLAVVLSKYGNKGDLEDLSATAPTVKNRISVADAIADGAANVANALDVNQDGAITKQEILSYLGH